MLLAAALFAAVAPSGADAARVEADAHAVMSAADTLAPRIRDDTWLDGQPGSDRLAEAQWRAVRQWAADWRDAHPGAPPDALARAAARLGDAWQASTATLGDDAILVAISHDQFGTAFMLAPDASGTYRPRWSLSDPQTRLDRQADRALSWWRPAVQNAPCPRDCRFAVAGSVGPLPSGASGTQRFFIDAYYAQPAGATIGKQLSIWSWRTGRARPLLVREYVAMADQPAPVLRGAVLHVAAKREWRSLGACGACVGRDTDLRFAVTPGVVRALPPRGRTPELDLVDEVFARVLARRPVGALASSSAQRVIRAQLADRLAEPDPTLKTYAGMILGWKRWRARGEGWACVNVDGVGSTAFAFDPKLGRILAARALSPNACRGGGTRS